MIQLTEKLIGYDSTDRTKLNTNKTFGGVQMTFDNGYTISIQFGFGNYCENRFKTENKSNSVEVAIFDKDDNFYRLRGMNDDVEGYVSIDKLADYIHKVKNLKSPQKS